MAELPKGARTVEVDGETRVYVRNTVTGRDVEQPVPVGHLDIIPEYEVLTTDVEVDPAITAPVDGSGTTAVREPAAPPAGRVSEPANPTNAGRPTGSTENKGA